MKKIITLLSAISFFVFAHAQFVTPGSFSGAKRCYYDDDAWKPREHNVDFIHMTLTLSFDVQQGLVKGTVVHRFTPLREKVDSIWVDGPDIRILEASVNGHQVKYRTEDAGTWIMMDKTHTWNETDSMKLVYEANPRKGLYFIGWNDPANVCRKQIWSQGQGIDNRNWIPFYDEMNDKITTDVFVTFDKAYKVLSNGNKLAEKENSDGTKTWHYQLNKPFAPYLVMLGIGIYDIKETKSKSGVPMHLYYYPDWKDRVDVTYKYAEQMIDFYENEIGVKYPWPSYSQLPVQDFMYGAMENVTATVYGDFLFVDEKSNNDRGYVAVNAHELAHQWFGDFVTARSDAHHWLQESFATYYDALFERSVFGDDPFDWTRRDAQNASIAESQKNLIQIAHSQAGSVRHYPKGAFVLNMLKYVVGGRDAYNRGIKYYLDHHAYSNVTSDDLLNAFHESEGLTLNWFWDEWIYHGGEPSYNVTANDVTDNVTGKRMTRFVVEQMQQVSDISGLFKMPIWFEVHYTDGTMDHVQKWIENKTHTVDIPNPAGKTISYVLFDPNNEVMKTVKFDKPFEWLKNQAMNAPHMLDRYDALVAMRDLPLSQKRDVLQKVYAKETFHGTKGEIAMQLIDDTDPASRAIIHSALADKDVRVQKHVLGATKIIPADLLADYEKLLSAPSYDLVGNVLDMLCTQHPENIIKYLDATKNIVGTNGRNVEIKRLEWSVHSTQVNNATQQLVAYTGVSYEFRTRVNAAQALKHLDYFDETLMKNLINASFSSNTRMAGPCSDALAFFYNEDTHRKVIADYVASQKWLDWQKEILNDVLK